MEIYTKWFENIIRKEGMKWNSTISVHGVGKRKGPTTWFAEVALEFSPSNKFEVVNLLEPTPAKVAQENGWIDFIIFGVFDVMLVSALEPIKDYKLTIQHINFNELESNQIAFRKAGYDAALKAITLIGNISLK